MDLNINEITFSIRNIVIVNNQRKLINCLKHKCSAAHKFGDGTNFKIQFYKFKKWKLMTFGDDQ